MTPKHLKVLKDRQSATEGHPTSNGTETDVSTLHRSLDEWPQGLVFKPYTPNMFIMAMWSTWMPLCSVLCTVTLLRVDWEAEAKLAQAQQRTIDSLEAAIAFGASPEAVLEQEVRYQALEEGVQLSCIGQIMPRLQCRRACRLHRR